AGRLGSLEEDAEAHRQRAYAEAEFGATDFDPARGKHGGPASVDLRSGRSGAGNAGPPAHVPAVSVAIATPPPGRSASRHVDPVAARASSWMSGPGVDTPGRPDIDDRGGSHALHAADLLR